MTPLSRVRVRVIGGPDSGRIHTLSIGTWTIGRSTGATVSIDDPQSAAYHANLSVRPDGVQWAPSLGEVARVEVGPQTEAIRIGTTLLRLDEPMGEVESESNSLGERRVRHRPPRVVPTSLAPLEAPVAPPRPEDPRPPQWSTMIAGAVVGLIVSAITGQHLIALFGVTALAVAGITWSIGRVSHRRALSRWEHSVVANAGEHRQRLRSRALEEAEFLWNEHPSPDRWFDIVRQGSDEFWTRRPSDSGAWHLAIGSSLLRVSSEDSISTQPIVVPSIVDLGPGSVVGIVGEGDRIADAMRALIVRLAVHFGPSDVAVVLLGDGVEAGSSKGGSLDELRALPHVVDEVPCDRHVVIVATSPDDVATRSSPWRRLVADRRGAMIVAASSRRSLPEDCERIVEVTNPSDGTTGLGETIDGMSRAVASPIVDRIATWIDPDSDVAVIPSRIPWTRLWDGWPNDGAVSAAWVERCAERGSAEGRLVARFGWAADGRVDVDLVSDGPHAVVVGTTGSGKSELLRTWVTSLAIANPPTRLNFVLIDFKGGAAFDACAHLPHVAGYLTDLDGGLAERVVSGLRRELRRRESALRAVGASDVADTDLPRLVIVVDELARLQTDVPDFVASLVDIAQRGRSLGVHLIVATQRGGGSLSTDLLANTSLRIALRLQSRADSMDVLGVPDAHFVPRRFPGRAIVRAGQDDPVVFQCADTSESLAAVVESIRSTWSGVTSDCPWTPPLPELVDLVHGRHGLVDEDDLSGSRRRDFRAETGSDLLIEGRPGSGKTMAATLFARAWLDDNPSGRVLVVANRLDQMVGALPGRAILGVAHFDDTEMVDRILTASLPRAVEVGPRLLVVDDADVWRSRSTHDRRLLLAWERFERTVAMRSGDGTRICLTTTRVAGLPSTVTSRIPQQWRGSERVAGRFDVGVEGDRRLVQLASVPMSEDRSIGRDRLATLPTHIDASGLPSDVIGLRGSDLAPVELPIDSLRTAGVFVVIGPDQESRSRVVRRFASCWSATRVDCVVSSDPTSVDETGPTLLAVEDAAGVDVDPRIVSRALRGDGSLLVVAGVDPVVLRARPDHWLNVVRRVRSGILLGRSSRDDGDLLGLFSQPESVFLESSCRGTWVDRGAVVDTVQIAVDESSS